MCLETLCIFILMDVVILKSSSFYYYYYNSNKKNYRWIVGCVWMIEYVYVHRRFGYVIFCCHSRCHYYHISSCIVCNEQYYFAISQFVCPSIRHVVVLYLNEFTCRHTFWTTWLRHHHSFLSPTVVKRFQENLSGPMNTR